MSNRLLTEAVPVAKKRPDTPPATKTPKPSFERIEFQAPAGFQDRIDRIRGARGLSRSAYIRQAVLLLMQEDEKEHGSDRQ
jgi:ribbon-helix-helix CopG family protein